MSEDDRAASASQPDRSSPSPAELQALVDAASEVLTFLVPTVWKDALHEEDSFWQVLARLRVAHRRFAALLFRLGPALRDIVGVGPVVIDRFAAESGLDLLHTIAETVLGNFEGSMSLDNAVLLAESWFPKMRKLHASVGRDLRAIQAEALDQAIPVVPVKIAEPPRSPPSEERLSDAWPRMSDNEHDIVTFFVARQKGRAFTESEVLKGAFGGVETGKKPFRAFREKCTLFGKRGKRGGFYLKKIPADLPAEKEVHESWQSGPLVDP